MCSSAVEKNNTHPNKKNLKSRVVKKGPILANLHKTLTDVFQTNLAVKPNVFFTRVALYKKAKKINKYIYIYICKCIYIYMFPLVV